MDRKAVGQALLAASRFSLVMSVLLALASFPQSTAFAVREIEVSGTESLAPAAVVAESGIDVGTVSIFTLDSDGVARRLVRHPRIASAEVWPRFPHRVLIRVQERTAVAAVPFDLGYATVDGTGYVIEVLRERPVLPLLSDRTRPLSWAVPGQLVGSAGVREALKILPLMPEDLKVRVDHLQLTEDREVMVYLNDGLEVRLGGVRGLRERLRIAPEVLQAVGAGGPLEYVDMRLQDNVVIKPRSEK